MSLSIVVAVLQIVALVWVGLAALDIVRKQTLAKNMEWVLEHPDFLHRHHRADKRPLLVLAAACMAVVAAGPLLLPAVAVAHLKYAAILSMAGVLCIVHYVQERRIAQAIPKSQRRYATMRPRSIGAYAPRALRWIADGAFGILCLAYVAFFLAGAVPSSFAVGSAVAIAIYAVSVGWGRWAAISERSPHFQQVRMVSDQDLSENYRRFAVQFMLILQIHLVVFMAAMLVLQVQGTQLVQIPIQDLLRKWFGEEAGAPAILSIEQYDLVYSLASIPLLVYIPFNRAFKDIRKIDLLGLVPRQAPGI